jgi:hypothetical protein
MMESPFGFGSPAWSATPSPAIGWGQPIAGRTTSAAVPGFGAPPFLTQLPQGLTQMDAYGYLQQLGVPGVIPAVAGPEVPNAPTARALVTAVAARRGQPMGPSNDQEVEEVVYDAFEWLLGANEVEVRCEGGRITLTGSVAHKRIKRDVGEVAWAIPAVSDVQNNVTIAGRRRARGARESEPQAVPGRKSA